MNKPPVFLTSVRFARHLVVLSCCLAALSFPQAEAARIKLTKAEMKAPKEGVVEIVLSAEGEDVDVGCYFIRVNSLPPDGDLAPQLLNKDGMFYVFQPGAKKDQERQLLDNGRLDKASEPGVFAYDLDVRKWPPGHYVLEVGATNRPAKGDFIMAKRRFTVTLGEGTVINGLAGGGQVATVKNAENIVVFQREGIYACFPTLMTLADGNYGVHFDGRTVHSHVVQGEGGRGYFFITKDGGRQWEEADGRLVDRQRFNREGALVAASAQGWITVPASERGRLEAEKKVLYVSAKTDQAGAVHYLGGAESRTSVDGGKTWQKKAIPLPEGCRGVMSYSPSASELVMSSGVRIVAVFGTRHPSPKDRMAMWEPYLLRSEDDGKTWVCMPMWEDGIKDPALSLGEAAITEAADGSLVAMIRNALPGGEPGEAAYLYQARSTDGGLTWSEPEKTPMWGFPAALIPLRDGRLFCVYGYRRPPMGIRAVLSGDHGKTWDIENPLIIRADADGYPGDTGYPSVRQMDDGTLLIVYYITTETHPRNTHIAVTRLQLP